MRILQVVQGFLPESRGGTEIYTYNLSKELSKNHEVHIFYPGRIKRTRGSSPAQYENALHAVEHVIDIGSKRSRYLSLIKSLGFKGSSGFKGTYGNGKVDREFEGLLDAINPDIVHFLHLLGLSASLIKIVKLRRLPVVLTLHDFWFICPRINLLKSDYSVCKGPDIQSRNCFKCYSTAQAEYMAEALVKYGIPRGLSKALSRAYELSFRTATTSGDFKQRQERMKSLLLMADKLIAPSMFLKNVFIENAIPGDRIIYSSNGYDLSAFEGFERKKHDKLVFGFAGGVAKHKGVHVLVKAFSRVESENVELRIYGTYDAKSSYFKELQYMIRNDNIKFMGSFKDVREPYSEIDVLVVPSICYESFSLVIREAFITRTPVIASNMGALPEIVEHNKNGLLFRPGDSDDLYDKIRTLIENPGLIGELQANIGPVKSIVDQVGELEVIYRAIIEEKSRV
jgi:glycosyltransferase involved in cell wall biosynthesis